MDCLFYVNQPGKQSGFRQEIKKDFLSFFWRPSLKSLVPPSLNKLVFAAWAIMHFCRLFANRDYGVFLVFRGGDLVHRSCVFPGYFRFPFMSEKDLQIGDTWTASAFRRRGFATYAMNKIVQLLDAPGRRFWYVTEKENIASIKAAERAGFLKCGEGVRTKRFGHSLFGTFEMMTRVDPFGSAKSK